MNEIKVNVNNENINFICVVLSGDHMKEEPTLSHCAWANTLDIVVQWQI